MDSILWIWIALLVILILFELASPTLTTIWFAGGSLFALILAIINMPIWIQIVAFLVISLLLLIFTRPFFTKYLKIGQEKTNIDSFPGEKAKVTEEIRNIDEIGTVIYKGLEWMARSEDNSIIPVDVTVEIVRVTGAKLIVKQI